VPEQVPVQVPAVAYQPCTTMVAPSKTFNLGSAGMAGMCPAPGTAGAAAAPAYGVAGTTAAPATGMARAAAAPITSAAGAAAPAGAGAGRAY
jgi:hypothetical protein